MLRPLAPLEEVLPEWVITYLKDRPDDSVSFRVAAERDGSDPVTLLFIKTEYAKVQQIVDTRCGSTRINTEPAGNDIALTIGWALDDQGEDVCFEATGTFDADDFEDIDALATMVSQSKVSWIMVTNDCRRYLAGATSSGPISFSGLVNAMAWAASALSSLLARREDLC